MFKLSCFADVSNGRPGMMIPIFSASGVNLPYAQEMDEYYISTSFIPFLEYENYPIVSFDGDITALVGDLGLVSFRRPTGDIFCGSIDTVIQFSEQSTEEIESDPMFLVQVNRLIGADMQHSYDPWRNAAMHLFAEASQQKLWLSSEMSFHQKQATIWRDIEDKKDNRQVSDIPGDIREYSYEFLIRWLANPKNLGSNSWAQVWRRIVEHVPFDSRLPDIGLGWLFSNLVENSDPRSVKWVLYSYFSMQYFKYVDCNELSNFLCESIKEGEYILFDLASPEKLFIAMVEFIIDNADDDRFFMFLGVLVNLGISYPSVKVLVKSAVDRKTRGIRSGDGVDPLVGIGEENYKLWLGYY